MMKKTESYLYREIAEGIRRRIASGELQPDDRLPPVRTMAKRWGCTPGTVSRAYAELSQEGLVQGRRGGGTLIAPGALLAERPLWGWATLINRAEQFLLEGLSSGHSPAQVESALSAAIARWRDLESQGVPPGEVETAHNTYDLKELRFAGSHDLTVELLRGMCAEETSGTTLSVNFVGSLGGLMALARDEADIAGIHLWDATTDRYNIPFVRRLLPGQPTALLTLAHRSLGLIVPRQDPQGFHALADLSRPDIRMVNRQAGSGTRVWLDAQLKARGITPETIVGYDREELTHLSVARVVEQGEANVGVGIFAAAAAYGLDFVPLTQECYQLAFPERVWRSAAAQSLAKIIHAQRFKEAVVALGGYDTNKTGQETWVS
jgi:molybdate-binding protein/DNA-binding transcriptional regulator YhcF (GntR family)